MSRAGVEAAGCLTALGDASSTCRALLDGRLGLALQPVRGSEGGDAVPLALLPGRPLDETLPPSWLSRLEPLAAQIPAAPWGTATHPIFFASSNFGVGSLHAFRRGGDAAHLAYATPEAATEALRRHLGWGSRLAIFSHACVSAHLALLAAGRALDQGAEKALAFSFDFLSPFVAGGFHALKILNGGMPAPFADRPVGSIGLGDGAAFAVLSRSAAAFSIAGHSLHNEMAHFTANEPEGKGFRACLTPLVRASAGGRVWIKAHGTGTLEAGRLEALSLSQLWPGASIVSWKGSLGHTLGSCGLVELAVAMEAVRAGRTPGTVGTAPPCFAPEVATAPFSNSACDAVLITSNAFGGAHAAFLLRHD